MYQPDRLAYIFLQKGEIEEARVTYAELDRQTRAIGALLQARGAEGKPVLLLHPPGLAYVAAFFGCLYARAVAVPAYPPYSARMVPRIKAILADTQARLILTTQESLADSQRYFMHIPDLQQVEWIATDSIAAELSREWQEPQIDGETIAFLQYTSGSTAVPKGVMVTHRNLLHNLDIIDRHCQQTIDSHMVSWLPPYHDMGLIGGILYPFSIGYPATLMSPAAFLQRPFRWLQAISRAKATISVAPNFSYDLCCRYNNDEQLAVLDLTSWNTAVNGAEPIRDETLSRFVATFEGCGFRPETFLPAYGLAEATLMVCSSQWSSVPLIRTIDRTALEQRHAILKDREDGDSWEYVAYEHLPADQKIAIVAPETLKQCSAEQVGEIWISGPSVAKGYWNKPEETSVTFQAYIADTGEGPFLRTGDLGFMQEGMLFVTGRIKDLIIIHGRNHYPQDIELTVEQSHPAIRHGCCAAFSLDIEGKEQLIILAEMHPRYRPGQGQEEETREQDVRGGSHKLVDGQAIIKTIRRAVAEEHSATVHEVVLLKAGSLPKTSSGKLQRRNARAAFQEKSLSVWGNY